MPILRQAQDERSGIFLRQVRDELRGVSFPFAVSIPWFRSW